MSQNFIHFLIIALLVLNTILLLNCSHIMGGSREGFAPKRKEGPPPMTDQQWCMKAKAYRGSGGKEMYEARGCQKYYGPF